MSFLDPKNLPENIRKCMEPRARKELGTPTIEEACEKHDRMEELEIHAKLADWCRLNEIPFVHSRTDRKTTTARGIPDFVLLWNGKGCAIELKGPTGKLTDEQEKTIEAWRTKGVPCLVARNLKEAIDFAVSTLLIHIGE